MLKVEKVSIKEKAIRKSPELDSILALMKKHNFPDGMESLPKAPYHEVSFDLTNTYPGFANGIRRALIEEIDVICANADESKVRTDDEFISGMSDVLLKNINLLPVRQSINLEDMNKYVMYLIKANKTQEIIDVTAADIIIGNADEVRRKARVKLQKDLGDPSTQTKKKTPVKVPTRKTTGKKRGGADAETDEEVEEVKADANSEDDADGIEDTKDANLEDSKDVENTKDTSSKSNLSSNASHSRQLHRHTMTSNLDSLNSGSFKITEAILARAYNEREQSAKPIEFVFPNSNICIARLRPGKTLYIEEIGFSVGKGIDSMAKFSLLNNVKYNILNVEPYDAFNQTGVRSIEYNPKEFRLEFTTCGNIAPKKVISLLVESILERLVDMKKQIELYASTDMKKYYSSDELIVTVKDEVFEYKFTKHYVTEIIMVSQRCFLLDQNILFCTGGVERYDTKTGVIKLKHADPNKLMLKSIEGCIADLKILDKAFV